MKKLYSSFAIFILLLTGCNTQQTPIPTPIIVPSECELEVGEEFPLSLMGSFPSDVAIEWEATKGSVSPSNGVSVVYTAPQTSGKIIITVITKTGNSQTSTNIICEVVGTSSTASPAESAPTTPTPSTTSSTEEMKKTIAISEIMADPCGELIAETWNEYIEIYNYGQESIDINGWWIAISDVHEDTPNRLVSWETRYPGMYLGKDLITNSSIIPPMSYAIILSPQYYKGEGDYSMPYIIPANTTILTQQFSI